ncbi:pyridoxal-dependent decarboxylase [Flavihumibacter fluvii]|uniref:pyridoxal-dependent decarboxylase n=1 Tax=Flavihumibacter fluvii TaxID=2838157 RepID=UPI001BDF083F|nr:pyridoxal-dependent decarboxylase [Flavihumibacter fluvii]ULQ53218.1 pyridoxal-dependent decarboxylase [Flavihumibacter fluvii]
MENDKKNAVPYGPKQLPWSDLVPDWANVTGPQENPIDLYDQVPPKNVQGSFPVIDYRKFEIPPEGLTPAEYEDAMAAFKLFITTQHKRFTGYQTNEFIEGNEELSWMLDIHTNNVGDPFTTGIFALNTKFVERAVLDYFAALWRAGWPFNGKTQDPGDRYWGYVMSMGSTEGNIYGLYNGRVYLSGGMLVTDPDTQKKATAKLRRGKYALEKSYSMIQPSDADDNPNKYKPIAFYSEDTHYSVIKGVNICSITTFAEEGNRNYKFLCPITADGVWPDEVPSHNMNHDDPLSGTIKVDDLEKLVEFFVKQGHPIFIVLNQGSTWKGAYDDVPAVDAMLKKLGTTYPWLWNRTVAYQVNGKTLTDTRRGFWVHVDGALGATYLPFLRMAEDQGKLPGTKVPVFDFSIDAVMSIVCSIHKWIGAPWPGGVYMTKRKFQINPPDTAGYIGSPDTTLGGSRNGFTPMLFWKYFAKKSYAENIERALETERVAAQFEAELRKLESELQQTDPDADLWIHRSSLSLAILFRMVNPDITYKYTVDSERILVPFEQEGKQYSQYRTYAHIYSMPSLGEYNLVDQLIGSIREACKPGWKNAFPDMVDGLPNPGTPDLIG